VTSTLAGFDALFGILRIAFVTIAALTAVICAIDWLVRTRRVSPFSPLARFFRQVIDPLLAPVERHVVRAGGMPAAAPWWALSGVVVGGIIVLSLLRFVQAQLSGLMMATYLGPMGVYRLVVSWTFAVLQIALIVRVLSTWVRVSPYSKWIRWSFVLTEPMLRPLRSIIPPLGMVDISPIVAYFVLRLVESFLLSLA
jgi:YggT family protein